MTKTPLLGAAVVAVAAAAVAKNLPEIRRYLNVRGMS